MSKVTFSILKMVPLFKARVEAPIVLVKIKFSRLPVNCYSENLLSWIVGNGGKVLKFDLTTL